MNPDVVLMFEGGYLRPLKTTDVHAGYISGLNDPEVNRYLDAVRRNCQTTQSVIDFVQGHQESNNSALFGIWETGSVHHCGTVRLHDIELYHKTAVIGICLFEKSAWGKHLGSKAIKTITQWALNGLELRWVEAGAYDNNVASQKAFLSAGYELIYEVVGKYIFEDKSAVVKVFAAKKHA